MTTVTKAEYARMRGVSRAAVSQWITRGWLTLEGKLVNVEQSDAFLKRFRRDGLAPGETGKKNVKPPVKQEPLNTESINSEPVNLTCGEVLRRLEELDHAVQVDWADEAQEQRARLAAQCVGWEAVQSDLEDDGHWGGFQLRIPQYIKARGGLHEGAVAAGFGFELDPYEVIEECRRSVVPGKLEDGSIWQTETDTVTVRLDLLPLLARPIFKAEDRSEKT